MTTLTFPSRAPNRSVFTYESNSIAHQSWLTGFLQSQSFGGEHIRASLIWHDLTAAQRAELTGWIADLNGMQNRLLLPVHHITQQGAFGGTPLVDGANQSGIQINLKGASSTITDWIKAGDWFSINDELKLCREDASSDGGGLVTVKFRPRIRTAPADSAAVEVTNPVGKFMLATSSVQWSNRPGGFSELSMEFIEDVV